jgi:hypothetical protein
MYKLAFILTCASLCIAGCTDYYKIVDPGSNKAYYTTDYDEKRNGAVVFTDERSGSTVTIQNSEVTEISKESFKAETAKGD